MVVNDDQMRDGKKNTDGTAIEDEEGPKSVAPITPAHTGSSNSAHGVQLTPAIIDNFRYLI